MKLRAWAFLALGLLAAGCGANAAAKPAAVVNGHAIPMALYTSDFRSQLAQSVDQTGYNVCGIKQLAAACGLVKQKALNDVIDAELVREYAATHGIRVTAQDAQRQWADVFRVRFDNRPAVVQAFVRRVGISESDLRRSLRNDLLQQRVMYAVTRHLTVTDRAVRIGQIVTVSRKELQHAQKLLAGGSTFPEVVNFLQHTSLRGCGQSQTSCGDLGWVPYSFIPPSRRKLETAPVGSVVGPIQEGSEYALFQIEARAAHYQLTSKQVYAKRTQVFVTWLQKQQQQAKVQRYVTV